MEGRAPYDVVLTHGFVLDGNGRKMSKSQGNDIPPDDVIKRHGAELLRLWVAAEDYRGDIPVSEEILGQLVDAYRRLRNTARFLLSNLYDFDPARDAVPHATLPELERWALHRTHALARRVRAAYEAYEFHVVYHALNNFCSVDLSALYLDVRKDRLYCERPDGPERRAHADGAARHARHAGPAHGAGAVVHRRRGVELPARARPSPACSWQGSASRPARGATTRWRRASSACWRCAPR